MVVCFAVAGTQAAVFVWDGGAATTAFGDAVNWNPDGTTFTAADEYQMTDGSLINAGANFSVGGFDISGGSQLAIANGTTFDVNVNNITSLDDGTLTVDGTLDFGINRWNTAGGGMMGIIVNGTMQGIGNFYTGSTMDLAIAVNGTFAHKISTMGSIHGKSQVLTVNGGGVFDVNQSVTLRSNLAAETAVYLNGGTMNFSGTESYIYSSLALSGDNDGIIFTDAASQLTLDGDRTTDVNTWITDGALSSTVGDMTVSYDGGLNKTLVAIPEPATLGLIGITAAGVFLVRRNFAI